MALRDNLPPDPFKDSGADLTQFAANCNAMYMAFIGAGFTEPRAFEFTWRLMAAMFTASTAK